MITPGEIQQTASKEGVPDRTIEKDYVIGWILKGISQNRYLKELLVFKGGTVLKKVWYHDFRYSEDLDFTIVDKNWDITQLESEMNNLCQWVYDESRIKLELKREQDSAAQYKGYIDYVGPLGGQRNIKLDISKDELIFNPPISKPVLDEYSDAEEEHLIQCYSLEEVLAEKLRCTMQRMVPRDIYDIWYLTEQGGIDIKDVVFGFIEKAKHKDIDPKNISNEIAKKKVKYTSSWNESLKHQIKDLPEFDVVWRELQRQVKELLPILKS